MSKSTSKNEDTVPESYPYYWSPGNSISTIEEFVTRYKPSMVQNDGTKPWLWVQNSNPVGDDGNRKEAIEEAAKLLAEATENIQKINDDGAIPTRSNKKTGAKSKKQLKEEIQTEATEKLKDVHVRLNYKSGKWLVFVAPDHVDTVWSRIANSVATGSLSETVVYLAKVATTPTNESFGQRVICIYMPDVLGQQKVTEVMNILLRNHGLNLSGVKSNLYTEIGLDSKHTTKIQSTIWKNVDLMKESQIKELKEAFYAELKAEQEKSGTDSKPKKLTGKPKPVEDDPFGSADEEEDDGKAKDVPQVKPKPATDDPFASSDEEAAKGKTGKAITKRKKGNEDENGEKPKTKAQKLR